jgi:hypothetical protein
MIPNHKRPNLRQQKFIVRAINLLGYEPFNKPIIGGDIRYGLRRWRDALVVGMVTMQRLLFSWSMVGE